MSYVFSFDASACTGCKACQAACKDKNNLPVGVLWRRVFEISGGQWMCSGNSWLNDIFAYNFSIACNHCVHPKCAGVCPTNAYHVRDDGIVLLDSSKCIGCGYCNWACPYAVPQYNPAAGHMSKCNFCADNIDAGLQPACVSACPMRVLGVRKSDQLIESHDGLPLWKIAGAEHPFPLPEFSRTQPHILLIPHLAMKNGLEKVVANREEIRHGKAKSEFPLVLFTLIVQMSVGAFWAQPWLLSLIQSSTGNYTHNLHLVLSFVIGICLFLGMLIAFAHLGTKRNAWRVFGNLKKSWLSKEIMLIGLFGLCFGLSVFINSSFVYWSTAIIGFGLIYGMANVYKLRSIPAWNSWRTMAAFLNSAVLLGVFLVTLAILLQSYLGESKIHLVTVATLMNLSKAFAIFDLAVILSAKRDGGETRRVTRVVLVIFVLIALVFQPMVIGLFQVLFYGILFLILMIEESIGRWSFYDRLNERNI